MNSVEYLEETKYPVYPVTTGDDHKTGTDGKAAFEGLTSGYYEVSETELPAGYVLTGDGKFYIKVENGAVSFVRKGTDGKWYPNSGNDKMIFTAASGSTPATAKIGNVAGTALPNAGGSGTALFTALGGLLTVTAGAALTIRSRKGKTKTA